MKVPTRTLIGHALDWAVATCEGATREDGCFRWPDGRISYGVPLYSTEPSQAWPIIDRENITVGPHTTSPAIANYGPHQPAANKPWEHRWVGPTKLVAAMRCFVAKRLGDEIEIPEEFL